MRSKADLLETVKSSRVIQLDFDDVKEKTTVEKHRDAKMTVEKHKDDKMTVEKYRGDDKRAFNIITSNLPSGLSEDVDKFCRMFKGKVYKEFTDNITHVVVYQTQDRYGAKLAKRTLKYLNGLIQGCWIVSYQCISAAY